MQVGKRIQELELDGFADLALVGNEPQVVARDSYETAANNVTKALAILSAPSIIRGYRDEFDSGAAHGHPSSLLK